jgi:hypothetical protein
MISIRSAGSETGPAVSGSRRPLFAADALALIGGGLGWLLVGAATGRWAASLVLVGIAVLAMALDVARALVGGPHPGRTWRGFLTVLDFDVLALGMLAGAWAAAGAPTWAAIALGVLGPLVAVLGYAFRRQVLAALLEPRSSPLGIVLALVPAVVVVAGGTALIRSYPGPGAPTIVMAVVGLYVLLFAQAALLRVQAPGWRPPVRARPGSERQPGSDTRSRQR